MAPPVFHFESTARQISVGPFLLLVEFLLDGGTTPWNINHTCCFVSSANLLKVHCALLCSPSTKMSNKAGSHSWPGSVASFQFICWTDDPGHKDIYNRILWQTINIYWSLCSQYVLFLSTRPVTSSYKFIKLVWLSLGESMLTSSHDFLLLYALKWFTALVVQSSVQWLKWGWPACSFLSLLSCTSLKTGLTISFSQPSASSSYLQAYF